MQFTNEIRKIQEQKLHEDENTMKQLMISCLLRKNALEEATKSLEKKNEEYLEFKNYLDMAMDIHTSAVNEKKQMQEKLNNLKSNKPNLQDQKLLDQGRSKFNYYKTLTRIHWDFEAMIEQRSIVGYITNGDNYIKHFNFKTQKANTNIINKLWQEILLSTKYDEDNESVNDENREPNTLPK